jgi:hypothetical protein
LCLRKTGYWHDEENSDEMKTTQKDEILEEKEKRNTSRDKILHLKYM